MLKDGRCSHRPANQSRDVMISKALSRLLRHAAVQDRIPIDSNGYVRMDHLLGWQRLKSMQPRPTITEVIEVVTASEKQRFGLRYAPEAREPDQVGDGSINADCEQEETEGTAPTDSQKAISVFETGKDTELAHYFIRANQGHSMKDVEAENLLRPITLEDEQSIPETVVHGTFYGAWESILKDRGLRCMNRNHVHFAMGPPLDEVMRQEQGNETGKKGVLSKLMAESKVVSGMRPDAQILVYVDVRKALRGGGMKWWRSENGVVLSEGMDGVVGMEFWEKAVEVKQGLGQLWEREKGLVRELPTHLKSKAVPSGKGRGGGNPGAGGRGRGKPNLKMERDDLADV